MWILKLPPSGHFKVGSFITELLLKSNSGSNLTHYFQLSRMYICTLIFTGE